jgi:uncharacterized protein
MTPHQFSSSAVRELVLNISEGCNLRCPYCFANDGTYHHDETRWMTEETAQERLKYAIDRFPNLARVKLFGGEPLMNVRAIRSVV